MSTIPLPDRPANVSSAPRPDLSIDEADDAAPSPDPDEAPDPSGVLRTALGALRARLASPLVEDREDERADD